MTTSTAARASGRRAMGVGAGWGGLAAARVLADHFEQVTVLDRDELPSGPTQRAGVPQGRHAHALLAGGQRALQDLFPGFTEDLLAAGAVPYRIGLENRIERPGWDPFPVRDLGFLGIAMSRPLIELCARQRLEQHAGVSIQPRCRVLALTATGDVVDGVRCAGERGGEQTLPADLVVDASGQGELTTALLASLGLPAPRQTAIGVDFGYASGLFEMPAAAPTEWKVCFTLPQPPTGARFALLLPLEGGRWIASLAGRRDDKPPGDWAGYLEFARGLRTQTIHRAISKARPLGEVVRFGFSASVRRHFEQCQTFPRGLLPFADTICRFNPIYGQGMSVAAQQACLLQRLLHEQTDPLALGFFREAQAILDTPWAMSALPDLAYPDTEGERPPNFAATVAFSRALMRLAAEDPAVHKLTFEVQHLLKPRTAYSDPELQRRVQAIIDAGD